MAEHVRPAVPGGGRLSIQLIHSGSTWLAAIAAAAGYLLLAAGRPRTDEQQTPRELFPPSPYPLDARPTGARSTLSLSLPGEPTPSRVEPGGAAAADVFPRYRPTVRRQPPSHLLQPFPSG